MRARERGLVVGSLPTGPLNLISDVPGVRVGHCTVDTPPHKTGVTVVLPGEGNPFTRKPFAAAQVLNGYGKTLGLVQVNELGVLETPIALTNTLNVGLVHDALVGMMLDWCARDGVECHSVNPLVAECNDASLNPIAQRVVRAEHLRAAVQNATTQFALGAVGGGRGLICHGFKGGIGSASRQMVLQGNTYTLGVLVQTNHGRKEDLCLQGRRPFIGQESQACDKGSCIVVMATDLPLLDRQIARVLRRAGVGLARLGSYTGHGSGEVFIGFSTVNAMPASGSIETFQALNESQMDTPFRAIAEATEEAVLDSMLCAGPDTRLDGQTVPALSDALYK